FGVNWLRGGKFAPCRYVRCVSVGKPADAIWLSGATRGTQDGQISQGWPRLGLARVIWWYRGRDRGRGRKAHVRHEATRVHNTPRRRGCRVAARGAASGAVIGFSLEVLGFRSQQRRPKNCVSEVFSKSEDYTWSPVKNF